jgi:hypothetical protein
MKATVNMKIKDNASSIKAAVNTKNKEEPR